MISFTFSIVLVIGTIIWAYFTNRLPNECYNEFDDLILNRRPQSKNEDRARTFRGFLLALSDQQLLSGLALVITINMIRNGVDNLDTEVTGYAYNNAVILAYFSCAIHLASLGCLRGYLQQRRTLKHIRVLLMICVFGLLIQGLWDAWFAVHLTESLRCSIRYRKAVGYLITDPDLLREYTIAIWDDIGGVAGFVIWIGTLASGYVRQLLALYSTSTGTPFSTPQIKMASMTGLLPRSLEETQLLRAKDRLSNRWAESNLNFAFFFVVVIPTFAQSFMFEIIWLLFYLLIGIGQFAYYIAAPGTRSEGYNLRTKISLKPDFGQLLPLVLLGLPLLAMFEGYSGESHDCI